MSAIARNASSTSPTDTPSTTSSVSARSPRLAPRGQGGCMDLAVLPYLERERVETERLQLPAQVEELAVGDALHPLGDERIADLVELGEQVVGPA